MSGETNDVTMHGYPPIPSEIPTTKDGWRQRAIGLKLRLSAAESQNQALQERIETAARYVVKMNHTLSREGWHTSQRCARCDLEPLLSLTQETDPADDRRGGIYDERLQTGAASPARPGD